MSKSKKIGSPNLAQKFLIKSVKIYQKTLSPDHSFLAKALGKPPFCKYTPSCSDYMIEAIEKRGAIVGLWKGMWRICRCNPWSRGGYDPVDKNNNFLNMVNFLSQNHNICQYTGYKTRVISCYFFEIFSEDDIWKLSEIFSFAQRENLPILFLSGGTNMLFATDFFDGVIIKNSLFGWNFHEKTKILSTFSGEKIWEIAESLEKNFSEKIWHRFIGLPGTIAGAVVGNAGCFGLETENNFLRAKIFDMKTGEFFTLEKTEMDFSYRHSILKENAHWFLVSAEFDLSEIHEKYASDVDNIDFRENRQPKGNSCGSFFKNPSKENSAGALIEKVGLKWYRHGGARWSDLHANFLLSDGEDCKPSDLIELVRLTQKKVFEETGFSLLNEVKIIENV